MDKQCCHAQSLQRAWNGIQSKRILQDMMLKELQSYFVILLIAGGYWIR